jgi:hypothetical protein
MQVITTYNEAVWPMQIVLTVIAFLSLLLVWKENKHSSRIMSGILGAFWIWMGIAYHWIHFTSINKAAWIFGGLFTVQGVLFLYDSGFSRKLLFSLKESGSRILAWVFFAYALVIYPIMGTTIGHAYPELPTFGLPCPTTIFTFGILLTSVRRVPYRLLIIPAIWSIIGFGAAVNFGIYEDIGLLVAGILGTLVITVKNRKLKTME